MEEINEQTQDSMEIKELDSITSQTSYRVRLYQLDSGQWVEQGTGYISLYKSNEMIEQNDSFKVVCENTQTTLLDNPILIEEDSYELQGDSLIVWTYRNDIDLALSFQEREGCKFIWNGIRRFQGLEENAEQLMIRMYI